MKLLFTQDALINAGTERSNLELLSRFSKDFDTSLVYFYPRNELKGEYQRAGIRLFFLDIPEKYHLILGIRRLVSLIHKEKPDLLVSSLWRADIITRLASWITGVPLVGTLVNDSYSKLAWKDKSGIKHQIVYWLDKITASIPEFWISNARALADSHIKTLGLNENKIEVVYRGRNIPKNFWTSDKLREVRIHGERPSGKNPKEQEESPKTFNFISYGRLLERKGFQDAINAFSIVIEKYPNCSLTIFGEGPFRSELEKLVQDLNLNDSIFLPGKISNPNIALINGYYPLTTDPGSYRDCPLITAHCFLFPSWYEGFAGTLVEAMMAGISIIASNISMNLEAVSTENALIFEVQNSEQLANQMIFAIENPEYMAELGRKAREEAIARFDIEKIAIQYEQTLHKIYQNLRSED
ncbi:glycosyltransferase family 4 protein [Algoriphagus halophilus]|uniref:Glycosyltransferase involved in cell wall bisynthesis n=1 Tax=Algoriphagus halophilus TaxID=226505 RepID=A0A1N6ECJ0_9BACT|nr:glycosyltransferase family 4 protein [Algoriphagus halophilus]SIN80740.1 Glycosyltransferase involved in cell wall bisynthesis [Algoriphagus halophilus]